MLVRSDVALPFILDECRAQLQGSARQRVEERRQWLASRQDELRLRRSQLVQTRLAVAGISETRLMVAIWEAVKDFPFVFTYDHERLRQAAPGVATLSGPQVYFGYGGGAAVGAGPGVAVGAALALKGTGKLPVAVLGDGEMLASIQALWTAAHHRIPGLWIVDNNRSYWPPLLNSRNNRSSRASILDRAVSLERNPYRMQSAARCPAIAMKRVIAPRSSCEQ